MLLTLQFRLRLPHIERAKVFGDPNQSVVFVYTGFCIIGIWKGLASATLLRSMHELKHNADWVAENWPRVRRAERKGYAKGRAQGIALQTNWKKGYQEEYAMRREAERQVCDLETALRLLKGLSSN